MPLVSLAKVAAVVQIIPMRVLPKTGLVAAPLLVLLALGCEGSVQGVGPNASVGGSATGAGGSGNLGGGVALPPGTEAAALLPARIRRLADAEYEASVTALVPEVGPGISADFIPDSRQSGFTLNEAQRVDPVFAGQLAAAASKLAANVRSHVAEQAPCANPTADADACATKFIEAFGEEAYRRPLAADEVAHLMTVFHAALEGGTYDEGIELVVRAMLQSASFLYLTEIGDVAAPVATVKLTPYELASAVSYLVQGRPPSKLLRQMAVEGKLDTPEGRYDATNDPGLALFAADNSAFNAQTRTTRIIKEWLGTDKISETAKDSNVYQDYARVKGALEEETKQFLAGVVSNGDGGSLAELLGGAWSMVNAPLASVYGVQAPGASDSAFVRVALPNRVGILNQGAFLSVFAHASESAPVLRGVAVLRRITCAGVPSPVDLKKAVVPPAPDPSKTTRQRYAEHAASDCAACHNNIDSFGFAFEAFDGMGKFRTRDNDKDVDSSVVISGTDFDGAYPDSNALAQAMSTSPQVRECFARHVYRALAATSVPELKPSEDDFVKHWQTTLATDGSGKADAKIIPTLVSFITNASFAYRRGL